MNFRREICLSNIFCHDTGLLITNARTAISTGYLKVKSLSARGDYAAGDLTKFSLFDKKTLFIVPGRRSSPNTANKSTKEIRRKPRL